MATLALQIYDLLPGPLRSAAASLRGYQLRRWRYGPESERLVREVIEREHWTSEHWGAWQAERLRLLLRHAAANVPYYRAKWQPGGEHEAADYEQLEQWPILEKASLRQHPAAFLSKETSRRRLFCTHTSGTTGTPLAVWQSRATLRAWYALFEARCRHWYGVSRHDRWAILGGQMVAPVARRTPPFWVWNAPMKQLYMSSYHLAPDLSARYVEALKRHRIVHLLGYTSSLYALAQQLLRAGRHLPMKVVVVNAEPLYDYQRATISRAFCCPVRETYGMAEKVAAASECDFGRLHLWPEVGAAEVLDQGRPVTPGKTGELVVTGLLGNEMPLIRYRCGDRVTLAGADSRCECGRTLPLIDRIEGRSDDVLLTVDGREVGRLDPIFKLDLPIEEAQIIQESLAQVRVLYVPAPGFGPGHKRQIAAELEARMGRIEVVLEEVAQIRRTANGKFRAVICRVPQAAVEKCNSGR